MKITITTVYDNIDQPWLDWYIARLRKLPELAEIADCLKNGEEAVLAYKDPTSDTFATTTYKVTK